MEAEGEYDSADSPVGEHSNPYGHWAEASEADEIYAEAESENPHGDAGGEHGEFYVAGGSEAVGRDEGHYPYDWFDDCDPGYHVEAHLSALGFHST